MIKLQKPFARGAEHQVCLKENQTLQTCDKVYKFPDNIWCNTSFEAQIANLQMLKDLGIKCCSTNVLNPGMVYIESEMKEVPYLIEQEFVTDPTLNEIDLQNEAIRMQLLEYLIKSDELYVNKGMAIDFLGAESMKCLIKFFFDRSLPLGVYNFKKNNDNDIYLLDTGILKLDSLNPFVAKIINTMIQLQHYLIFKVINYYEKTNDFFPKINFATKSFAFPAYLATRVVTPFKNY